MLPHRSRAALSNPRCGGRAALGAARNPSPLQLADSFLDPDEPSKQWRYTFLRSAYRLKTNVRDLLIAAGRNAFCSECRLEASRKTRRVACIPCWVSHEAIGPRTRRLETAMPAFQILAFEFQGAAALYITCNLPSVLGSSSVLGALSLLLIGVTLGILLVLGGVVSASLVTSCCCQFWRTLSVMKL